MDQVEIWQRAYLRAKFALPGHVFYGTPFALWGYAMRPAGVNSVSGCTFEAELVRVQVDEILRTYQAVGQHSNWFFGPSATPSDLSQILRKERRMMGPRFLLGMRLDLRDWTPIRPRAGIEPFTIMDWDAARDEGYPGEMWTPKAARDDAIQMLKELSSSPEFQGFGAYCEGRFASSCLVFMRDGIAGLSDVVTKPEFRGRGLATAAMTTAMAYARENGAEVAVLQSHKKAAGLYERIGFREIGTFTSMYYSRIRSAADAQANGLQ